jgi:glycosyltransferase involved in cell wall biosynthesis
MRNAIFILARNCETEILSCLTSVVKIPERFDEMILINNNSTDQTLQKVLDWQSGQSKKIIIFNNIENYGLGGSHKIAFEYAKRHNLSEIAILHGDNQTDISPFLKYERSNKTLLGARFISLKNIDKSYSKGRAYLNLAMNLLFSIRLRRRIYDMGSGLNIYGRDAIESFRQEVYPDDMTFNYYHLSHICAEGLSFSWMPITWKSSTSNSNVKIIPHLISTMILLMQFRAKTFDQHIVRKYNVL